MMKRYIDLLLEALKGEPYDYTQGSLKKAIFLLAVPMILELSLESIFAVVDIFFVGRLGEQAIATVGFTESLITIIYSIAIGLSTAATAVVARRIGEHNQEGAAKAAYNTILIGVLVSIILAGIGIYYADELLAFMGADEETIRQGRMYTIIMFGFNIVVVLLFLINGIFRGAGDASLAMKSLWIASLINIILDPILIYGIGSWSGYGLKGAAIATVIGRGIGVLYQIRALLSSGSTIRFTRKGLKIDLSIAGRIFSLSLPATLQFIIASGSWIVMTKMVADHGGISAAAGYQVAVRNIIFFILPAWGLSNAAATLVGQNLGAELPDRAEKSARMTLRYNTIFMTFVSLFFLLFAPPIIKIFINEPEALAIGILSLRIIGGGFVVYGIGMVLTQAINGAGDTRTPTYINFICFWLVQIPLAYVLGDVAGYGVKGVVFAIPFAEGLLGVLAYVYFRTGRWKNVKV
jgi:putative MATE family efflux protein